jgi:hypothetical protein
VGESSPGHLEDPKGETAGRTSSSGSSSSDSGSSSSGKWFPYFADITRKSSL